MEEEQSMKVELASPAKRPIQGKLILNGLNWLKLSAILWVVSSNLPLLP